MTKTKIIALNPRYRPHNSVLRWLDEDGAGEHLAKLRPANDNGECYSGRWPVEEEYKQGLLGPTSEANNFAWDSVLLIGETWNMFRQPAENWFANGTRRMMDGGGFTPGVGNLSLLRGAEISADAMGFWGELDRKTYGCFWKIVKPVIVDQAEMRDLAPDVPPKKKRAAIGRAKFLEVLPYVTEEVFQKRMEMAA